MNKLNYYFYQVISILLHPLLMLFYVLFLMNLINPYEFISFQGTDQHILYFQVIVSSIILPGIAIIMMYSLGLLNSLELDSSKERIFPFIATAIFYLWLFANLVYNPMIPKLFNIVVFGAIIGLFLSMVINLFIKLSIHSLSMSSLLTALIMMYFEWLTLYSRDLIFSPKSMVILIILIIFLTGLVGTARLQLRVHSLQEIYLGYLIGFLAPVISYFTLDYIFYG